ncbi:MAG: NapC/NirT family cytochrome c [Candidatus Acidiferrales bacterium]
MLNRLRTIHFLAAPSRSLSQRHTCARLLRVLPRLVVVACGVAWPFAARAQQDAFQQDPVDLYGSRFLAAVIVVGLAVVLYSLFRYRGKDSGPVSWGLLIVGTCIFPMILSGFGTILVVERVKTVKLCGSCHLTMKSYVEDMMNPQSNSLAAVHYTNRYIAEDQCYECHTSYGMLGTLQAKKQGLIDVYKYYTRTFQLPLRLRHPYPGGDCLKCHAGATKWLAAHEDTKQAIFAGTLTCMRCHAETNPAHNVPGRIVSP